MKRELCAVKDHFRKMPEKKPDPVKEQMTARLWDEFVGDECEAALIDALAVGDGFELHGGLV